ncbi:hypothetical protein [Arthrobacter sp. NPDC090010]|uniref:hypothetical protein n=1 Tax=Arthrobacter sp. NPDC090010 TaxID=3363942 RepID=UPI0038176F80
MLSMIRTLFWSSGFHPDPLSGRPGSVRRRAVPSAGGCYPVQVHTLCGTGCDVPPGLYAFDAERGVLVSRNRSSWPVSAAAGPGAVIGLSVLPQRTAAKYHHRALPLLVADTAYAVAALAHHAAWHGIGTAWLQDDPASLAAAFALPDYGCWPELWPGTGPELVLAALSLGGLLPDPVPSSPARISEAGPSAVPERSPRLVAGVRDWAGRYRPGPTVRPHRGIPGCDPATLSSRRSLALTGIPGVVDSGSEPSAAVRTVRESLAAARLSVPFGTPDGCRSVLLDWADPADAATLKDPRLAIRCAGQGWLGTLDGLVLFESGGPPGPREMWWAASLAAHVLYGALRLGATGESLGPPSLEFRPVGGWTGEEQGRWTVHGLGFRTGPPRAGRQGNTEETEGSGHAG